MQFVTAVVNDLVAQGWGAVFGFGDDPGERVLDLDGVYEERQGGDGVAAGRREGSLMRAEEVRSWRTRRLIETGDRRRRPDGLGAGGVVSIPARRLPVVCPFLPG
ncbi:hypothetical protein JS562_53550, partial [Agrobacterium sp. S2]|nr:hypothetical protein [Agrobacterium sp. S2]